MGPANAHIDFALLILRNALALVFLYRGSGIPVRRFRRAWYRRLWFAYPCHGNDRLPGFFRVAVDRPRRLFARGSASRAAVKAVN